MSGLLYIFFVAAVAYFAKSKGRSPLGWALIAIFISPLIAGIILFFLKNLNTGRYDGDTIDTTAKPVPDEGPRHQPGRLQTPGNKPKVDVDESIRRMEDKLAKGKEETDSSVSDDTVTSVGAIGAATVLTENGDNQNSENETAKEPKTTEPQVIELGSAGVETTNNEPIESEVVEPAQPPVIENVAATSQAFCESCGQPLTPGGKFCTNCGAPVAK